MTEVEKLQNIKETIEKMSKIQQIDVLKLLLESNIETSENSNGTFINLTELDETIITKLVDFIMFIEEQNKLIEDMEIKKQLIQENFFDTKNVIKTSQGCNLE